MLLLRPSTAVAARGAWRGAGRRAPPLLALGHAAAAGFTRTRLRGAELTPWGSSSRQLSSQPEMIRNCCVIAHIDHGKTTLTDKLIQADVSRSTSAAKVERLMDSMSLEKERGISIMSKYTRIDYADHVLNIVDTPGHADFGGEVERVLEMVDGAILVVDATEGPMAQTKFVLSKAIERGLQPIVVINKVDRESSRVHEVESEILDLFIALGAPDEMLDYPVLYASAKEGWAVADVDDKDRSKGMGPLLQAIIQTIPAPCAPDAVQKPFALAVNSIATDSYVGRLCMGKIHAGAVQVGDPVRSLSRGNMGSGGEGGGNEGAGSVIAEGRVTKLYCQRGMDKVEMEAASAGDIVWIAGVTAGVADTVAAPEVSEPLPTSPVDPPTMAMTLGVNDSPLAGREGKYVTGTHVLQRLEKELENNVSIALAPSPEPESVEVLGRGELQMGILITEMRREGYELSVSPPRILTRKDPRTGKTLEPVEEVVVDVDQELAGVVVEKLNARKGSMIHFGEHRGKARLVFEVPSRGLLGFQNEVKTDTRGSAVVTRMVKGYEPSVGQIDANFRGKLISMESGRATAYALNMLEDRGILFVEPGEEVYGGMVIGEHNRPVDLEVNPTRAKKMSNVRSVNADEAIRLAPPKLFVLEEYIAYMNEDEKLEVTPTKLRLRKRELDAGVRARKAKANKK